MSCKISYKRKSKTFHILLNSMPYVTYSISGTCRFNPNISGLFSNFHKFFCFFVYFSYSISYRSISKISVKHRNCINCQYVALFQDLLFTWNSMHYNFIYRNTCSCRIRRIRSSYIISFCPWNCTLRSHVVFCNLIQFMCTYSRFNILRQYIFKQSRYNFICFFYLFYFIHCFINYHCTYSFCHF